MVGASVGTVIVFVLCWRILREHFGGKITNFPGWKILALLVGTVIFADLCHIMKFALNR